MSPFETLGLDRKADLMQIKRAYARLLRTHRPDEDPVAFQRLHEAYEACLDELRWRDLCLDDDEEEDEQDPPLMQADSLGFAEAPFDNDGGATQAVEPLPAHDDDDDDFDAEAFGDELLRRLREDMPQAVDGWLQAHDDLYSLDRKHRLQPVVVAALEALDPATAARHFENVTRFFGLDTVAGVDAWLHHRLDDIQRRFGDATEFERVLRSHAGPNASWTDQGIARELLQSFSWLRRLCLIVCPGLPGRTGALARALQAADPESASARLNDKARRFWERATNRNGLQRERLGFMATRVALWTMVLSAYTRAIDEGKSFFVDWASSFAMLFLLWLAYALVVLGLIRFRDYNQARMQWDWLLLITLGGVGCGIVAVAAGASGVIPFVMTTVMWVGARNDGDSGHSASQVASLTAGLAAFGFAFLALYQVADGAIATRYLGCAAAVYAFAVQGVHDAVLARAQGIALTRARLQTGWMWRVFQVHAGLLVVTAAAMALLRPGTGA